MRNQIAIIGDSNLQTIFNDIEQDRKFEHVDFMAVSGLRSNELSKYIAECALYKKIIVFAGLNDLVDHPRNEQLKVCF